MQEHKWELARLSAGEKSALKRNAGIMMDHASMEAVEAFFRALPGNCAIGAEKVWFACLCMDCLWREEDHDQRRPFQELLRSIYQDKDASDSMRKRCTAFLDLPWSDDGFLLGKLCGLARIMRSGIPGAKPDFELLADDLLHWNHRDHYIQRKWLGTICRVQKEDKEEATNHAD